MRRIFALAVSGILAIGSFMDPHPSAAQSSNGGNTWRLVRTDSGEAFDASDLRGGLDLIFFGYTFSPDITPLKMAAADDWIPLLEADEKGISLYFATIDPARDDVDRIKDFLGYFKTNYVGLTGDRHNVSRFLEDFGVWARKDGDDEDYYLLDSNGGAVLVDENGSVVATFGIWQLLNEDGDFFVDTINKAYSSFQMRERMATIRREKVDELTRLAEADAAQRDKDRPADSFCFWRCDPLEQHGRLALQNKLSELFETPVIIVRFRKTNGVRGEVNGVETYELQYEANIEFPFGVIVQKGGMFAFASGSFATEKMLDLQLLMDYQITNGENPTEAMSMVGTGAVTFRKTESGWQAYDGVVYER